MTERKEWSVEPCEGFHKNEIYEGDRYVGQIVRPNDAAAVVNAVNARLGQGGRQELQPVLSEEERLFVGTYIGDSCRLCGRTAKPFCRDTHDAKLVGDVECRQAAAPVAARPDQPAVEQLLLEIANALYILPRLRSRSRSERFFPGSITPELLRRSEEAFELIESACNSARAALSRAPAGPQWQPIATAPRDGRFVLGWTKAWADDVVQVRWLNGKGCWNTTMQPTHWMPLPPAPKDES